MAHPKCMQSQDSASVSQYLAAAPNVVACICCLTAVVVVVVVVVVVKPSKWYESMKEYLSDF